MKYLSRLLVTLLTLSFCFSCNEKINKGQEEEQKEEEKKEEEKKEEEDPSESEKTTDYSAACRYLRDDIMKTYYYWYDQVPRISYSSQTDIYDFFDALLVEKDRWSWMMDGQTYMSEESGTETYTYGADLAQPIEYYDDYSVCVSCVYPDSPFEKAGVKRGWIITHIDGEETMNLIRAGKFVNLFYYSTTSATHTFTFSTPEGTVETKSITAAASLVTRPCLMKKIFTDKDYPGLTEPVGYFNYLSFRAETDANGKPMLDDISETMDYFAANNVKKLILDLRYNGGGDSRASDTLVSYLAPASSDGKVYVQRRCNKLLSRYYNQDTKVHLAKNKPEFDRIYIITTDGSASASEMVLNGLKPLADIQHVGDTTYGKPNGMFVFLYPYDVEAYDYDDYSQLEWVFLPICFYNMNGNGEYIPDDGLVPDNYRPDDLYHDFGPEEDNIAACLHHVVNGSYPSLPAIDCLPAGKSAPKGVKAPLTRAERDPHWGTFTVKM